MLAGLGLSHGVARGWRACMLLSTDRGLAGFW